MANGDPTKYPQYYSMNVIEFLNIVAFVRDKGRYHEETRPKT